mmetsp:Transcript_4381/g.7407  ORF Transcript_4381/g.7407 Transcript_4381/m.7407 type:complete len:169 (+) Transcript_4381:24-530(+)
MQQAYLITPNLQTLYVPDLEALQYNIPDVQTSFGTIGRGRMDLMNLEHMTRTGTTTKTSKKDFFSNTETSNTSSGSQNEDFNTSESSTTETTVTPGLFDRLFRRNQEKEMLMDLMIKTGTTTHTSNTDRTSHTDSSTRSSGNRKTDSNTNTNSKTVTTTTPGVDPKIL